MTYRVTATVRVNGELRSGSSLQRMTVRRAITLGSNQISNIDIRSFGEAVGVPIVGDAWLLVTMRDAQGSSPYSEVLASPCQDLRFNGSAKRTPAETYLSKAAGFSGTCTVAEDRLPQMLSVFDTLEPEGFVAATPPDFSNIFEDRVEFVDLKFTRTDEPLSFSLHKKLAWVRSLGAHRFGVRFQTTSGWSGMYPIDIVNGEGTFE